MTQSDQQSDQQPDQEDIEFYHRYGPWDSVDPAGAQELLEGYGGAWWVVGGYAIEAFTGVPRRHEDCDVAFFRKDLDLLRAHLGDRFHLWSVGSGALRPLTDRFPDLPEWAGQVWMREHALAPWRMDCLSNPDVDGRWQSKRDETFVADLDEVTWVDDRGIRFLNPEVTLLFKAHNDRAKDLKDLETTWPRLSSSRQQWLREEVRRLYPEHHWNDGVLRG